MSLPQRGLIVPEVDKDSAAWWAAVAEHRFTLPWCMACQRFFFPPMPTCPHCGSKSVTLCPASGRGRIYSWVVVNRALDHRFVDDAPYTIVAVALDEGARMFGRLVDGEPEADAIVSAWLYETQGQALVGFRRDALTGAAKSP
jgi:uncharacterized OB-fold protein